MVTRTEILKILPRFKNSYTHIADNQSVTDIMKAMKDCHNTYKKDYDLICHYFIGSTEERTCKNIFNFLRKYTNYVIETEDEQTVKSPAALLEQKNIDCKGYALFACGVLDAINRTGKQYIPNSYRFVSDSFLNTNPNHVFCVAFPECIEEEQIWIDPIPQIKQFDDRLTFYYNIDKKNKMSLYSISGTKQAKLPVIGISVDDALGIVTALTSVFKKNKNQYLNDWQGWDAQDRANGQFPSSSVRGYVWNDGDYVDIESQNIVSYISANGFDNLINSGYKTVPGKGWGDVTIEQIADKLRRGRLNEEANAMISKAIEIKKSSNISLLNDGSSNSNTTKTASMNLYTTLAIVGAGIYFLTQSKNK